MGHLVAPRVERAYAGLLGKAIGVCLGAPLEVGLDSPEHIRRVHGLITGYIKGYSNFAADDDTNGIVFPTRDARLAGRRPCAVTADEAASGARSLKLEAAGLVPGGAVRAFYKPLTMAHTGSWPRRPSHGSRDGATGYGLRPVREPS